MGDKKKRVQELTIDQKERVVVVRARKHPKLKMGV